MVSVVAPAITSSMVAVVVSATSTVMAEVDTSLVVVLAVDSSAVVSEGSSTIAEVITSMVDVLSVDSSTVISATAVALMVTLIDVSSVVAELKIFKIFFASISYVLEHVTKGKACY